MHKPDKIYCIFCFVFIIFTQHSSKYNYNISRDQAFAYYENQRRAVTIRNKETNLKFIISINQFNPKKMDVLYFSVGITYMSYYFMETLHIAKSILQCFFFSNKSEWWQQNYKSKTTLARAFLFSLCGRWQLNANFWETNIMSLLSLIPQTARHWYKPCAQNRERGHGHSKVFSFYSSRLFVPIISGKNLIHFIVALLTIVSMIYVSLI